MWGWLQLKAEKKSIKSNRAQFFTPSRWLWTEWSKVTVASISTVFPDARNCMKQKRLDEDKGKDFIYWLSTVLQKSTAGMIWSWTFPLFHSLEELKNWTKHSCRIVDKSCKIRWLKHWAVWGTKTCSKTSGYSFTTDSVEILYHTDYTQLLFSTLYISNAG